MKRYLWPINPQLNIDISEPNMQWWWVMPSEKILELSKASKKQEAVRPPTCFWFVCRNYDAVFHWDGRSEDIHHNGWWYYPSNFFPLFLPFLMMSKATLRLQKNRFFSPTSSNNPSHYDYNFAPRLYCRQIGRRRTNYGLQFTSMLPTSLGIQ